MSTDLATFIIPSSPADLKKIDDAINEMVSSKTRAKAETDLQNEIIDKLHTEFKISKTWIRNAASDRYAGTFHQKVQAQDEYEIFYEKVQAAGSNAAVVADHQTTGTGDIV